MRSYFLELWNYMIVSAPYFLIGLVFSSAIHYFLNKDSIKKYLGGKSIFSVFKAALFGVPLPLCSCSVVPAAVTLRKNGASTAATSSFLISTPESGVDSIAMTYGLIGPAMAIIRPIAAFVTAFVAGVMQLFFDSEASAPPPEEQKVKSCCHKNKSDDVHDHDHTHEEEGKSIVGSIKYGFIDLLEDMAGWLTIGLLLGAFLNMVIPDDFFQNLGSGSSMLAMLVIGVPFYICASASTPIAAALLLKGLSSGSALVFLLVGPATNLSNIVIVQKYLGKKAVFINLVCIVVISTLFGIGVDYFFPTIEVRDVLNQHQHRSAWESAAAVVFTALLLKALYSRYLKKYFKSNTASKEVQA